MIHESGMWSPVHRKWYFLPRRCSKDKYDEVLDEKRGCNILISADENFRQIDHIVLGDYLRTQGFSSFKFIPGSGDSIIVALQTEEIEGKTTTYITAFTITGNIVLPSTKIDTNLKYEGLEFTWTLFPVDNYRLIPRLPFKINCKYVLYQIETEVHSVNNKYAENIQIPGKKYFFFRGNRPGMVNVSRYYSKYLQTTVGIDESFSNFRSVACERFFFSCAMRQWTVICIWQLTGTSTAEATTKRFQIAHNELVGATGAQIRLPYVPIAAKITWKRFCAEHFVRPKSLRNEKKYISWTPVVSSTLFVYSCVVIGTRTVRLQLFAHRWLKAQSEYFLVFSPKI